MDIKKKYLDKYLRNIAIEQLTDEYTQKGFEVKLEEAVGDSVADIVARRGNEQIIIEVKFGSMTPSKKLQISKLSNYARKEGYKFIVVFPSRKKDKKLEVDNIEQLLFYYLSQNRPSFLDDFPTYTALTEVSDLDIDEIKISGDEILISGDGVIVIEINEGFLNSQDSDNLYLSESFPFEFELVLDYDEDNKLQISEVKKLEIDSSSLLIE